MNVFKRISSFTRAKLAKNSKRYLFVYHFFAINYENVCDNHPFLTFFQRAQLPSFFLLPFSPFIHKKDRKQISTSLYIIRCKGRKREQNQSYTTNVVVRMPLLCDFITHFFAVPLHRQSEERQTSLPSDKKRNA